MIRRTAAVLAAAVALAAPGVSAAHASPLSSYIEQGSDDPVTAQPAVSTPDTRHCTVTLADQFPSNAADGSPQNYSGTLTAPQECQGPWTKVVLSSTTTVSGRQYDRSGTLAIGGVTVWFGTTQEPAGATPTTFGFTKDITDFSSLLKQPQSFTGGYGNYTSSVYTGVYRQTVKITYYMADRTHPAPTVPDTVVAVPVNDLHPGASATAATLSDLPRNITGARLQLTLKGNGCDEQWFTAVPDEVAAKFPGDGLCAASAYREAAVSVDGQRAGAVGTFPHIYSGGIVPTLWRPVLAQNTLDLRPETLDLTPFAGALVDGRPHTVGFSITPLNDNWNVAAVLFLFTDHHRAQTSGKLTRDDVAEAPATAINSSAVTDGAVDYRETAKRSDVISGYVDSSSGRITTTVTTSRTFANAGTVSDDGLIQTVRQSDVLSSRSVSTKHGRPVATSLVAESYPITVNFSAADYKDDQNFSLKGSVDLTQNVSSVTTGRGWPAVRGWTWNVDTTGVLSRAAGVTSESDGSSTTSYRGTDDRGRFGTCRIATDHGRVITSRAGCVGTA